MRVPKLFINSNSFVYTDDTKIPFDIKTGKRASVVNEATWSTYREAKDFIESHPDNVLGVVVNEPFVCIDLDHVLPIHQNKVDELLSSLTAQIGNFYAEISPSNHGLHLWFKTSGNYRYIGRKLESKFGFTIEIYSGGKRYITVTGNTYGDYSDENVDTCNFDVLIDAIQNTFLIDISTDTDTSELPCNPYQLQNYVLTHYPELGLDTSKLSPQRLNEVIHTADILNPLTYGAMLREGEPDVSKIEFRLCVEFMKRGIFDISIIDKYYRESKLYQYRLKSAHPKKWAKREDYRLRTLAAAFQTVLATTQTKIETERTIMLDSPNFSDEDKIHLTEDDVKHVPIPLQKLALKQLVSSSRDENALVYTHYQSELLRVRDELKAFFDCEYVQLPLSVVSVVSLPHDVPKYVDIEALSAYISNMFVQSRRGQYALFWLSSSGNLRTFNLTSLEDALMHAFDDRKLNLLGRLKFIPILKNHYEKDAEKFASMLSLLDDAEVVGTELYHQKDVDSKRITKFISDFDALVPLKLHAERAKILKGLRQEKKVFVDAIRKFLITRRQVASSIKTVYHYNEPNYVRFDVKQPILHLNKIFTLQSDDTALTERITLLSKSLKRFVSPDVDVSLPITVNGGNIEYFASRLDIEKLRNSAEYKLLKHHFEIDDVIKFIIACDVSQTAEKLGFLLVRAPSNFGKTYLFKDILSFLTVELPSSTLTEILKGATVGVSSLEFDAKKAVFIDEWRAKYIDKVQLLSLGKYLPITAKFELRNHVKVGAKIFVVDGDPFGESVDEQFRNRFSLLNFTDKGTFDEAKQKFGFDIYDSTLVDRLKSIAFILAIHYYHQIFQDGVNAADKFLLDFHERHKLTATSLDIVVRDEIQNILKEVYETLLSHGLDGTKEGVEKLRNNSFSLPTKARRYLSIFAIHKPRDRDIPVLAVRSKGRLKTFLIEMLKGSDTFSEAMEIMKHDKIIDDILDKKFVAVHYYDPERDVASRNTNYYPIKLNEELCMQVLNEVAVTKTKPAEIEIKI